ncbi:MAG: GTP-binding protein EngA, GTP-binding protein [Candidatus Peregrinibacteria bacterium GW2011_GWF2_33_10]|nr:MAG: GTP-binding protein EngA, GTP-binding protein [Candidatus Peregrinibacteria bacterium GW2011_GWF2_33_10]OGJ44285.1 MAG: ribosome biogenesis GTPase Der [Candidatus Peregrinibacteria bacterium RIFOXYA12_FULL_33_12]OGJ44660.1 MAG: ribosome biogenesis GTPase Der [Candidatus Peregrinibacteria bacterium RIFOXYA2_FULL_33_21]OGJ50394.1 MAG: ribosome biogenesis GTPase Der [Candidatus Peregrinibacteria bacterium RIFOXYB2_FULL_33_20]
MSEAKTNRPIIAIIGRPNTGKSTLFNKLIGYSKAVTSEFEGTTRDRIFHQLQFGDYEALLVDTGGIEFENKENIEEDVQLQSRIAINDADLILFLVDGRALLTATDHAAANLLRKSGKEVILVANKCEHVIHGYELAEVYGLGFNSPIEISALNGIGIDDLEKELIKKIKKIGFKKNACVEKVESNDIKIAFAGRPNVGKSSLINAFFGDEKVIVSDLSGTTRDAIDLEFSYQDHKFVLIDTPGIRSPGKRQLKLEQYSVLRSLQSIEKSDVALLILDFQEGVSSQDCHVCESILDASSGLIIVINKSDLMESKEKDMTTSLHFLQQKLSFVPWAPVVFVSAKNKKNIHKILDLAIEIKQNRKIRIPTAGLNDFVQDSIARHHPTGTKAKRPKILYATQVSIEPPHFIFFVNDAKSFHFSYKRYLENRLREKYGFGGTAIKIEYRGKGSS